MKRNKYIKILGNFLTVLSVFFILSRLWTGGFDIFVLFQSKVLFLFWGLVIIQIAKIMVACFPWLQLVEILSGDSIPFSSARTVYVKSNIYKYMPGNVFQYLGRNELAVQRGISHIDVGIATLFDVGIMFLCSLCTAVILMRSYAIKIINDYRNNIIKMMIVFLLLGCILIIIFIFKYKQKLFEYYARYKNQINQKNIYKFLSCFIYYALYNVVSCTSFTLMIYMLTEGTLRLDLCLKLSGAYVLAFVIGFVTPGASGGLGIREAAMLVLSGGLVTEDIIILASIIMRFVGIIGDLLSFLIIQWSVIKKNNFSAL